MISFSALMLVALSIICWMSFAWAITRHFTRPTSPSWRMKAVAILGTLFGLLQVVAIVWTPATSPVGCLASVMLFGSALALFWWTVLTTRRHRFFLAFTPSRPTGVVAEGPYQWVRHPFYVSYMLYWIAGVWSTDVWWLVVSVLIMGGLYWRAAVHEETEFQQGDQAQAYRAYIGRTGRFFPRLRRRPLSESF